MALHVSDFAAGALAAAGVATTILPPDYAALGVAGIGGIIGGYLSVAILPESKNETRRTLGMKWAVSSLTSVTMTPFLFQRLTHATYDAAGAVIAEETLPNTAEAMLALSTTVAFVAWATLRIAQAAWDRWIRKKVDAIAPPRRWAADREKGKS